VFSSVGIGDYYYVAGVCRNWRGRYISLCEQATEKKPLKYNTCRKNIVMTAARLQLALDNGLAIDQLNKFFGRLADNIASSSLEPIAVLTVARCYGLEWHGDLPIRAARSGKLELLQWMHKCGCRFEPDVVICAAVERDYVDVVAWLYEQFAASFAADFKQGLLWRAGWLDNLSVAQCLREHGAEWPEAFCCNANLTTFQPLGDHSAGCWSLQCVQWAIANGCTWGQWRCQDYNVTLYTCCCAGGDHEVLRAASFVIDGKQQLRLNGHMKMAAHAHVKQQQQQHQQQCDTLFNIERPYMNDTKSTLCMRALCVISWSARMRSFLLHANVHWIILLYYLHNRKSIVRTTRK
jgi:hypothetical protein